MTDKNCLELLYEHDGDPRDSTGSLYVKVFANGFAGEGAMWVQWQDLEELAEKLDEFPLPKDGPIEYDWGYTERDGSYQSAVLLRFCNAGDRGPVKVVVQLADKDDDELAVKCKFKVEYAALAQFRIELAKMARSKGGSCILANRTN